jgi:hypothetical protein
LGDDHHMECLSRIGGDNHFPAAVRSADFVGSRGAIQLDGLDLALSRQRVSDVNEQASRNGGRSRIQVAHVAGRSAHRPVTDSYVVNRKIGPRARQLRNNRDFALR